MKFQEPSWASCLKSGEAIMDKEVKREKAFDKDRTITIALSVVVALLLWSYVMIQVNPTKQETIYRVPVNLLNEQTLTEKQLAILGDGRFTVDVVVEGKRSVISSLKAEDVNAEVQLFGWGKGENYISVDVKGPSDLKIVQVKPDKIKVNIEDLVTISKAVTVVFNGTFPGGTEESILAVRPSEVEIKGARTAVESVHDLIVTLNVGDISPEGSQSTREIVPINKDEVAVEYVRLSSSHANVTGKLLYKKEVRLTTSFIGEAGENKAAEIEAPATIIIKGEKARIEEIEEIETEPVDLSGYPEGGTLQLVPVLPDGIELSRDNPRLTARLIIVETASRNLTLTGAELMVQNLPSNLKLKTVSEENVIELVGEKSIIENLSEELLKFYVNAENLEPGEYSLPLLIFYGDKTGIITSKPAEIAVVIENISQESVIE